MRTLAISLGALVVVASVVVTASVVVWSVVGDAPWENEPGAAANERQGDDRESGGTSALRCEQALDLERETLDDLRDAVNTGVRNPEAAAKYYSDQLDSIRRDIDRYC